MKHGHQPYSEIERWSSRDLRLHYLALFAVVEDEMKARGGGLG